LTGLLDELAKETPAFNQQQEAEKEEQAEKASP
jgi:hypothetical protein